MIAFLPRGNMLSDEEWTRRHHLLLWVLGLCIPLLTAVGLIGGWSWGPIVAIDLVLAAVVAAAARVHHRRTGSLLVTFGLTSSSVALVVLSHGSIEAHFSFFVIVGFLALYQDWFPFLWNIVFTVLSHGIGSALAPQLIFNHASGQAHPWLWSVVHGACVLAACAGVLVFWRFTEDLQEQKTEVDRKLAHAEISKKEFTSDLLLNLARRNQSMFHRQLDIINELEERERDPDVLADLFRLDHLATRVRRNAESLLVLSGEQPPRIWSAPVSLRDVVRAAIAETEDLERITFTLDESVAVAGSAVADLTHLLAELLENAVRYSPPASSVSILSRPYHPTPGAHLLVIEDTGVGMPPADLAAANALLEAPGEVDVSASRRLGFHVVSRLAARHGIAVSLSPTPGCGVTAVLVLPPDLFGDASPGASRPAMPAVLTPSGAERAVPPPQTSPVPTPTGPPSGPIRAGGRHSWPGQETPEPVEDPWARPEERPVAPEPEPVATRSPRGGLIHPMVVPAPRETGGDGASLDPSAPTPRRSPESDGTAVANGHGTAAANGHGPSASNGHPTAPTAPSNGDRTPAANGDGTRRTLSRRVPQSHLAPELAHPVIPDPVPPPPLPPPGVPATSVAASSTGTMPDRAVFGPPPLADVAAGPEATDGAMGGSEGGPAGGAPLTALSRYQASRRMAHLEIGDIDQNGASS